MGGLGKTWSFYRKREGLWWKNGVLGGGGGGKK